MRTTPRTSEGKGGQRIVDWGTRDVGQVRHQTAGCEDGERGGGVGDRGVRVMVVREEEEDQA